MYRLCPYSANITTNVNVFVIYIKQYLKLTRIYVYTRCSRLAGASQSTFGPIEMIPYGLIVGWLRK